MSVLKDGEIVLYGFVGDNYFGDGFTSIDVIDALMQLGREEPVVVRINSGGGYVHEGLAIFNALTAHKGKVTVHVDAIAASSASIIAMAGDERVMRTGSLMMIHDPATITFGTADDHDKQRDVLNKWADQMAGIYAERTGEEVSAIRKDMKEELWLTGEEAVERGFATSAEDEDADAFAAFDYRLFAHAPQELRALAQKNSWSLKGAGRQAASSAAVRGQKGERPMSDKKPADAPAAESEAAIATAKAEGARAAQERIKAIMTCEEAKGREGLAQHFAYETEMTAEAAVSALAKAPKADAAPPTPTNDADPAAYEQSRVQAAGQAQPSAPRPKATINRSEIYASRRRLAKEG
jgi:ATP-dependent Clp protease, protease subunit